MPWHPDFYGLFLSDYEADSFIQRSCAKSHLARGRSAQRPDRGPQPSPPKHLRASIFLATQVSRKDGQLVSCEPAFTALKATPSRVP